MLTESFSKPRIEGRFVGDRMRAWDTSGATASPTSSIENSYVNIKKSVIEDGGSRIEAEGKFSLGYPRKDGGEEINASVTMTKRPLADLRHAFELDDYPVDGLTSGEFHVYGNYEGPHGVGRLVIEDGGSPTARPSRSRPPTSGSRAPASAWISIDITKSTGKVTGAAWVAWDGNYSFEAHGSKIPVESLATMAFPRAPLSGILQFDATGAGTFETPRYDVKLEHRRPVRRRRGHRAGHRAAVASRRLMLTMEFDASSRRLSVSGLRPPGADARDGRRDDDALLGHVARSLPAVSSRRRCRRSPPRSPTAPSAWSASWRTSITCWSRRTVDKLQLKLFDYPAANDGPIQLALNRHVVEVKRFRLVGEGTALELSGTVGLHDNRIALDAAGDANLGILQAFYRDIRSSGDASLQAQVRGQLDNPVFSGNATIANGRIRYFSLPHSLQDINARLDFDAQGIRVVDAIAQLGGGPVKFGGRIGLERVSESATSISRRPASRCSLRYPEGFRSTIDAALTLRGNPASLVLGGNVTLRDGVYSKRFEPNVDIFALASGGPGLPSPVSETATLPVRFDIKVQAPGTLRRREQPRAHGRARGSHAERHLRQPAALRPRRHRPRRDLLRGQPLPRDARHDRFPEPGPHRAVLRHRGRDACARDVAHRRRPCRCAPRPIGLRSPCPARSTAA